MARNKGTFETSGNFQVKVQSPLDARLVVDKKEDLIKKDTWPSDGDTLYIYNGMIVSVAEEEAAYILTDMTKVLDSDYSAWKKVGTGEDSGGGGSSEYPGANVQAVDDEDDGEVDDPIGGNGGGNTALGTEIAYIWINRTTRELTEEQIAENIESVNKIIYEGAPLMVKELNEELGITLEAIYNVSYYMLVGEDGIIFYIDTFENGGSGTEYEDDVDLYASNIKHCSYMGAVGIDGVVDGLLMKEAFPSTVYLYTGVLTESRIQNNLKVRRILGSYNADQIIGKPLQFRSVNGDSFINIGTYCVVDSTSNCLFYIDNGNLKKCTIQDDGIYKISNVGSIGNSTSSSSSANGPLRVWLYQNDISELTQQQVDDNIATYNAIASGDAISVLVCVKFEDDSLLSVSTYHATSDYVAYSNGQKFVTVTIYGVGEDSLATAVIIDLNADGTITME